MSLTKNEINSYLIQIKDAIRNNRYRIERNPFRQENNHLFMDYVFDEKMAKDLLLKIEINDFSERKRNEHKGYEHEYLYIFGKDVMLLERFGEGRKRISLYIKLNLINHRCVIVVSLHKQKYPLKYYFK